jgi:hypothetical protein
MNYQFELSIYVVHYSKLIDRKCFLDEIFEKSEITVGWVTENNFSYIKRPLVKSKKVLGISEKKLGMDLGINSRSLVFTRKKARLQGYILFIRSYFSKKNNILTTGSLPPKVPLPNSWQEVQCMHITALRKGLATNNKWILVLEDDAIPVKGAFDSVENLVKNIKPFNTWINLNSGAGLMRTESDKKPDAYGLFPVIPASTRCAVAYMVSRDLAVKMIDLIDEHGVPNWLPIDLVYQALLRKSKAKAYWQDLPIFIQGSEDGSYKSEFEISRRTLNEPE